VVAATPLRRAGRPDDVARVSAFLAPEDSGFVTGVRLPVTGGLGISRFSAEGVSWPWRQERGD
jgi:NAD(P)-dependent dehydrogenase (short-subunit alcohol dehydrogenase family)